MQKAEGTGEFIFKILLKKGGYNDPHHNEDQNRINSFDKSF